MWREIANQPNRIRQFIDSLEELGIILFDAEARIVGWNTGATRLMGWVEEEVLGQPGGIIFTPEDRADGAPEREIATALRSKATPDERWHVKKDGTRFWASGFMTALQDGGLVGFAKVVRDMTTDRLNRDKARTSESRLENTFTYAAVGLAFLDLQGRFLDANPTCCQITGRSPSHLKNTDLLSITHPDDRTATATALKQLSAGKLRSLVMEKRYVQPDGTGVWVRCSMSSVQDEDQQPKELVAVIEDISQRIVSERQASIARRPADYNLSALMAQLVTAEADQRRYIAHQLHEDGAQRAAALRMELDALSKKLSEREFEARLANLKLLADGLSTELLELSYHLHPPTLDHLGLDVTMQRLTGEFAEIWPQPLVYTSSAVPNEIPIEIGLVVYRVTEEALRTIAIQAPGSSICINLRGVAKENTLALTIETVASGSSLIQPCFTEGVEIVSIQERVRLVGGTTRIETGQEGSTRLTVSVPLPPPAGTTSSLTTSLQ
jgi:PAS domain S-box-containing protein